MPVPTITKSSSCTPRPAPKCASASAAARTSLSTTAGPSGPKAPATSTSRQSSVCAERTRPSRSTSSQTPMPMGRPVPPGCQPPRQRDAVGRAPHPRLALGPRHALEARLDGARSVSTIPAAIFVPPTSMPIACVMADRQGATPKSARAPGAP